MWRPKIMAQIVHRNHLFAVYFNLAYFVSGCNDNWIRLQGTGNLLVNCSLYLPSVYGSRSNIFHPEVSCVPRDDSNSKLQPERCQLHIQCVQLIWNKRFAMWFADILWNICGLQLQKTLVFFFMVYLPCEPNKLKHVRNIGWYLVMLPVEKTTRGREASTRYY